MPERPYTMLSCSVSLDGYLGDQTPRLALSNDGRLRPGRRGARLVRRDHGRRGHRAHRQPAAARALAGPPRRAHGPRARAVADEDHRDRAGRTSTRDSNFFTTGEAEKLVYTSSGARAPTPARGSGRWRRSWTAAGACGCAGSARTSPTAAWSG